MRTCIFIGGCIGTYLLVLLNGRQFGPMEAAKLHGAAVALLGHWIATKWSTRHA